MTIQEPVARMKVKEQHAVAPSMGAMLPPEIKGDPTKKEQSKFNDSFLYFGVLPAVKL